MEALAVLTIAAQPAGDCCLLAVLNLCCKQPRCHQISSYQSCRPVLLSCPAGAAREQLPLFLWHIPSDAGTDVTVVHLVPIPTVVLHVLLHLPTGCSQRSRQLVISAVDPPPHPPPPTLDAAFATSDTSPSHWRLSQLQDPRSLRWRRRTGALARKSHPRSTTLLGMLSCCVIL